MTTSDPLLATADAPLRCVGREQRLAAVKFVGLSKPADAPQPGRPHQNLLSRVLDLLTVARR